MSVVAANKGNGWFSLGKFDSTISSIYHSTKSFASKITTEKVNAVANSIIGKAVIYTVSELVGAFIGATIGGYICDATGGELGRRVAAVAFILFEGGMVVHTVSMIINNNEECASAQKIFNNVMMTSLLLYSVKETTPYGLALSEAVGARVGARIVVLAGGILGGYKALKVAGSPIVLWDKKDYHSCYLVGMVRYSIVGEVFGLLCAISKPIAQTSAYNSHVILPVCIRIIKKKEVSGISLAPVIQNLLSSNCGGNQSIKIARVIANSAISFKWFPKITEALQLCINYSALKGLSKLVEEKALFSTVILRSFHPYVHLVRKSKKIEQAYDIYKKKFLKVVGEGLSNENTHILLKDCNHDFNQAIRSEISFGLHKVEQKILELLGDTIHIETLIDNLLQKIPELEKEVLGIPQITNSQLLFLEEILHHYLTNFLLFAIVNFLKNPDTFYEGITSKEDCQNFLDLNRIISQFYLDAVLPNIFSHKIFSISSFMIKTGFSIFVQPDHDPFFNTSLEDHKEEYHTWYELEDDFMNILEPDDKKLKLAETIKNDQQASAISNISLSEQLLNKDYWFNDES